MPNFAVTRRLVLAAAVTVCTHPALAQPTTPPDGVEAGPPPNMECAAEPLTGSGPGFTSSRDDSEDAARAAWLDKAKAVYPEASWETAYKAGVSCAVQGLYSKCFAQAIPCKPKSDGADSAEAPKAE